MATLTQKINIIDRYNEDFNKEQNKFIEKDYNTYFDRVKTHVNPLLKSRDTKSAEIQEAVNDINIPTTSGMQTIPMSLVLSGVTNVIEKQQLDSKDKQELLPILGLIALYKLSKPKRFAQKVSKVTAAILSNNSTGLKGKDKKAFGILKRYYKDNSKLIEKEIVKFNRNMKVVNKSIKKSTSKRIFREYKKVRNNTTVSLDNVAKTVQNEVDVSVKSSVDRTVRTEIKRQQELVKETQHLALGYTHKRWNTQGDSKVSLSHRAVGGKVIAIDKKFNIPGIDRKPSARVMYPGDPSAPVGQIINERCFLTYIKRK